MIHLKDKFTHVDRMPVAVQIKARDKVTGGFGILSR